LKHRIFGRHVFVRWWNESEACYALGRGFSRSLLVRTLSIMAFTMLALAPTARAQNFTQVTASHLQSDASGQNVVRGKICALGTDQNDTPLLFHDGAGGLVSPSRPACATVTNGVIASFQVANSATTNPVGIYYRFQVTDLCAACTTANQVVHDLRLVPNVSGATFSLDSYVPTGTVTPPVGNAYWDIPEIAAPGNPASGFERFYANLSTHFASCLTSAGGNCSPSGGGGGYATIQNAASSLTQRLVANFFGGITCADNSGQSRTDCQIDTSSAFNPTWAGAHAFNGSVNLAGGLKINGGAAAGKIPIGDGTNFVPGDPLVQGLNAEGSTATNNPVNVGGFDTAGTPAIHGTKVLNAAPAGTEYGIVTRPIPSGTQTVSVSNTPAVTAAQLPAALDGSGFLKTHEQGTAAVSGTVTANAGSGTYNIQANASVNQTQVAGTAVDVNSGVKSAGTQRMVLATDQPQLTNALKVDGSAVTQPVSGTVTANVGTTNGLALDATLTGGSAKVKVTGNTGAALDAAGQNAASPANEVVVGAQFNTSPTTITSGNVSPLQVDNAGNLKVNIQSGGGSGGTASSFAAAFPASGTAIGVKNGANMVNLAADGSSNLLVNCAAGCSAAGDQTTGSTALGALNAVITLPLTGDNKATFQLQSGGTGVYTVTPQCSLDGGTLYNVNGYIQDPVSAAITTTATVASAQATTDYPIICPQGTSHAQMKVTAFTSGTANWLGRATVNSGPNLAFAAATTSAPAPGNNTVSPLSLNTAGGLRVDQTHVAGTAVDVNSGTKSAGTQRVVLATDQPQLTNALKVDGSAVTQPVSGTVTANQGGTWTVQPGNTANTTAWKVDGSAVTQPVSGTVTANIGTSGSLALDASVTGLEVAQASTTSGQKGAVVQGAVTTNAPAYTTAQTDPVSLDTAGLLRVSIKDTPQNTNAFKVDGSAVTQPVSGTVTANAGSGTYNIQANASVNVNQVAGSAVSTAATGVQKVGAVGNAGVALDAVIGAAAPANVIAGGLKDTAGNSQAALSDTSGRQIVKVYPDTTTA
jgi:hypothetical protein